MNDQHDDRPKPAQPSPYLAAILAARRRRFRKKPSTWRPVLDPRREDRMRIPAPDENFEDYGD